MEKYEFTGEELKVGGRVLRRIRAVRAFGGVQAGEVGGWIEKEGNLSHEGMCWVYDSAWVYGSAGVYGSARVSGEARVYGSARVYDSAWVSGEARVQTCDAWCSFGSFGSRSGSTTAHLDTEIGIRINCGCFSGSLEQFRDKVIETHGETSRNGILYLGMANMIEYRLEEALKRMKEAQAA